MAEKYDKAFILAPDALLSGLEGVVNLFDKKKENARHLIVLPEDFLMNWERHIKDQQPWDADGVAEFQDYIIKNRVSGSTSIDTDHPLRKDLGLYLRIVPTERSGPSRDLVGTVKSLEQSVKTDLKEPQSHTSNTIVISALKPIRTALTIHGFNVQVIEHKNVDPNIAQDYVTVLDAEDEEQRQKLADALGNSQAIPAKKVQAILGLRDAALFVNQYILFSDYAGKDPRKFVALRNNGKGLFDRRELYRNAEIVATVWQPKKTEELGKQKKSVDSAVHPNQAMYAFDPEQLVFFDLAFDPKIETIGVVGLKGTGKSSMVYATLLSMIMRNPVRSRHMESLYLLKSLRDIDPEERIGYLPGEKADKLSGRYGYFARIHEKMRVYVPFEQLIVDPHTIPKDQMSAVRSSQFTIEKTPIVELLLNEIRGLTIEDACLLVDEVQNFNPKNMPDITGRQGSYNSLFVFCGDTIGQIDNPRYDRDYNALSALVHYYKGQPFFGAVQLPVSHRSQSARHSDGWKTY